MTRHDTIPASIAFAITAPILDEVEDVPDTMDDLPPVPEAKITRLVPRAEMPVLAPIPALKRPVRARSRSLVFRPEPPSMTSLVMLLIFAGVAVRFVFMWIDGDMTF